MTPDSCSLDTPQVCYCSRPCALVCRSRTAPDCRNTPDGCCRSSAGPPTCKQARPHTHLHVHCASLLCCRHAVQVELLPGRILATGAHKVVAKEGLLVSRLQGGAGQHVVGYEKPTVLVRGCAVWRTNRAAQCSPSPHKKNAPLTSVLHQQRAPCLGWGPPSCCVTWGRSARCLCPG